MLYFSHSILQDSCNRSQEVTSYFIFKAFIHINLFPVVPSEPGAPNPVDWNQNQVDLVWAEPVSDGGSPITGYIIEKKDKYRYLFTVHLLLLLIFGTCFHISPDLDRHCVPWVWYNVWSRRTSKNKVSRCINPKLIGMDRDFWVWKMIYLTVKSQLLNLFSIAWNTPDQLASL